MAWLGQSSKHCIKKIVSENISASKFLVPCYTVNSVYNELGYETNSWL